MKHIVGVADLFVSRNVDDVLVTYALGSCLGVTAYDPTSQVGGLLHCQLPAAPRAQPVSNPAQFVDTGILMMLEKMFDYGAEQKRLVIAAAGGAEVMNDLKSFKIAHRNHAILRKVLWKNRLLMTAEDIGGTKPRTMSLELASGAVELRSGDRRWDLVPGATMVGT